jgi:hypothetical protein
VQHKYGKIDFSFYLKILIYFSFNKYRHLERARIVFAIESEMSTDERNLPTNKYWTIIDNERYLQVEEVDDKYFRDGDDDDDDDDDGNKESDLKKLDNDTDTAEL